MRDPKFDHPIYTSWRAMKVRCNTPSHQSYRLYGGRGIRVCRAWDEFSSFERWAKEAGWRPGLSLDRIDPNGDYTPENCRWATAAEQTANRRSDAVGLAVSFNGETASLLEWSRRTGIYYTTLVKRFHRGLRGAELFAAPLRRV
jgi:hypothetical protein